MQPVYSSSNSIPAPGIPLELSKSLVSSLLRANSTHSSTSFSSEWSSRQQPMYLEEYSGDSAFPQTHNQQVDGCLVGLQAVRRLASIRSISPTTLSLSFSVKVLKLSFFSNVIPSSHTQHVLFRRRCFLSLSIAGSERAFAAFPSFRTLPLLHRNNHSRDNPLD